MKPAFNGKGKLILAGNFIVNDKNEVLLLFKKTHRHWETPGGKVRLEELQDVNHPTESELRKVALRELHEEVGPHFEVGELEYFGQVEFTIPDGREAVVHKFITKIISGEPKIQEPETFSELKYLPVKNLGDYPLAPDIRLMFPRLKARFPGS